MPSVTTMLFDDSIQVTVDLAAALDALHIDYVVGGSVASSIHGKPRTTEDVDMVIRLAGRQVEGLVEALASDYYIDGDMVHEAIARRASFNIIHLATMVKVDLFVYDGSELANSELQRRVAVPLRGTHVWFASAEDIVLQKLLWYRRGDRISERQWRDVLGVLATQGERFDLGYTREWAARLKLTELLDEALATAG